MDHKPALSFWQKNKLIIKSFFIAFLVLALLIPTFIIMYLANDRKERKQEVTREISNKWSSAQTIIGPFLIVPYNDSDLKNKGVSTICVLPDELSINGILEPEIRYRSIYKVPVYTAKPLILKGSFSGSNFQATGINPSNINWKEARLCVGIEDLKGLKQQLVKWNETALPMQPGMPDNGLAAQGISIPLSVDLTSADKLNSFSIELILQGSEKLFCTPLGSSTKVRFASSWSNPAFDGRYLPDSESVTKKGFTADWIISQFNRDYPKAFTTVSTSTSNVKLSSFGVALVSPFDAYAQTMRSIKYAILIIALTFFAYFFTEIFQRKSVHPLQYILIGMALVVFYILLLSISEYIQFSYAYLISSAATVVLLFWYTQSIFKKTKTTIIFAALLSILYLFIYVLIQMQDNALLFGSIGLFALLATAMYLSRKIDWYSLDSKPINDL